MGDVHNSPSTRHVVIDLRTPRAQFSVGADRGTPVVAIAGEIDLASVDALAGCLSPFEAGDTLIVDLSVLEFIDSVGIVVLTRTRDRGVNLVCRGAHGSVRRALAASAVEANATPERS